MPPTPADDRDPIGYLVNRGVPREAAVQLLAWVDQNTVGMTREQVDRKMRGLIEQVLVRREMLT